MPGVMRPYTLVDVLGTINQQQTQQTVQISGISQFVEADETVPAADSMTTTVQALLGWDQGVWGALSWS